jgi:glycosyltransferase involved in cell wall biosynthesis
MKKRISTLYISYDGMLEPLGQSQVYQYLAKLALDSALDITLISYEKPLDWANSKLRNAIQDKMKSANIHWIPLTYHKRPSAIATAFDIFHGFAVAGSLQMKGLATGKPFRLVHARSYVASVIALMLLKIFKIPYIFDMRGFWPDERVDAGLWSKTSSIYKIAKNFERRFLLSANTVVSLTQTAVDEMKTFPYLAQEKTRFVVIPTCANLNLFRPKGDGSHPFTIGYVGTVGVWYEFGDVVECFKLILDEKPECRFLIINRGEHDFIWEKLKAAGIPQERVEIKSVDHTQVPFEMSRMNGTVFFIKPSYSKKASAPTKLGEFLGCGIPVLANSGVGDMDYIIEPEKVGVLLRSKDHAAKKKAVQELLPLCDDAQQRDRCVTAAHRLFSLETGSHRYREVYQSIIQGSSP